MRRAWLALLLTAAVAIDVALFIEMSAKWAPMNDGISWWVIDLDRPYELATTSLFAPGAFRFSPAIAQVMAPLGLLPWPVFVAVFTAAQLAAIVAMGGRRWPYVLLFPSALFCLWVGNVDLLMGAAIVAGFRWPGAWAFLLLTKVTPGVGVLWFAVRREWRNLAIALGTTAAIAAVSFVTVPHLWFQWVDALREMSALPQHNDVPLWLRLVAAVALVILAAQYDHRWLLPVACLFAVPSMWSVTYAILGASVALWGGTRRITRGEPAAGGIAGPRAGRDASSGSPLLPTGC